MATGSTAQTLLDEWRARRERLSSEDTPARFAREQILVLDFLIRCYGDTPEANKPARPRAAMDLHVAHRAIVVHHHLWEGKVSGVKTRQDAETRASEILGRLHSHASVAEPEDSAAQVDLFADTEPGGVAYNPRVWDQIVRWTGMGRPPADDVIVFALRKNPFLPRSVAEYLYRRIVESDGKDMAAATLLTYGRNRIAINFAVYAWRELAAAGRTEGPWGPLYEFLAKQGSKGKAAEAVRLALAHDNPRVRLAALDLLGRVGDLADISLLSDLLNLPPSPDEHPKERAALVRAMQRIAKTGR